MRDFIIVLRATLVSFFLVERKVSHLVIYLFLVVLCGSMMMNTVLLFSSGNQPQPTVEVEQHRMNDISERSKWVYVTMLSDLYAYYSFHESPAIQTKMPIFIGEMDVYRVACSMVSPDMEHGELKRLTGLIRYINENGCIEGSQ